jgi:hypothetical protein
MSRPRRLVRRLGPGLVPLVCVLTASASPASARATDRAPGASTAAAHARERAPGASPASAHATGRSLGARAGVSPGGIPGAGGTLVASAASSPGGIPGAGGTLVASAASRPGGIPGAGATLVASAASSPGGILGAGGALAAGGGLSPTGALGAGAALNPICGAAGAVSSVIGSACDAAKNGAGGLASTAPAALGLVGIGTWVLSGAQAVLDNTATVLGRSTAPDLGTTWFSSTYWRMGAMAAVLTLPFLFAAAVQAVIRSDLSLLAAATFGYLPLAALAIAIAAPLTMLLLAASDELSTFVSSAAGNEGARFLGEAGLYAGGLGALLDSPFLAFLVGLFTVAVAFAVWVELLLREAAVYVVVLMLPLAFAALVWPARRIWAMRALELLVALILAKFAIVAVLSLGGAAIAQSFGQDSISGMMAGAVLLMLAAFSPWALLRLIPLAELAGGAGGALRGELHTGGEHAKAIWHEAGSHADEWAARTTAGMRRQAEDVDTAAPRALPEPPPGQPGAGPTGSPERDGPPDAGRAGEPDPESARPTPTVGAGAEPTRASSPLPDPAGSHPLERVTSAPPEWTPSPPPEDDDVVREGNWEEPLVLGRENDAWLPGRVVLPEDETE